LRGCSYLTCSFCEVRGKSAIILTMLEYSPIPQFMVTCRRKRMPDLITREMKEEEEQRVETCSYVNESDRLAACVVRWLQPLRTSTPTRYS